MLANYPPRARAAGEQGRVFFTISLDRDGRLRSCEVTRSSGFPRLDAETCELMVAHGVFKTVKDENGRLVRKPVHEGAINWVLPKDEVAGKAPVAQKLASVAKPERLICRRISKTGSLATHRAALPDVARMGPGRRICPRRSEAPAAIDPAAPQLGRRVWLSACGLVRASRRRGRRGSAYTCARPSAA